MLLTEEEAKGKWCPYARASAYIPESANYGAVNRTYPDGVMNLERACCIASACMAWRPIKEVQTAALSQSYDLRERARAEGWNLEETAYSVSISRVVGYCGLSGKPE